MERIESLRKLPFEEGVFSDRFFYLFHREYQRLQDLTEWERYGQAFYTAFSLLCIAILLKLIFLFIYKNLE